MSVSKVICFACAIITATEMYFVLQSNTVVFKALGYTGYVNEKYNIIGCH